jgi:hypothetical protein
MKELNIAFKEELISNVFHPDRMKNSAKIYNINFDDLLKVY